MNIVSKINTITMALFASALIGLSTHAEDSSAWDVSAFVHNDAVGVKVGYDLLNPRTHQFRPEVLGSDGMTVSERTQGGQAEQSIWSHLAESMGMKDHPVLWTVGVTAVTLFVLENNTSMDLIPGIGKDNGKNSDDYVAEGKKLAEEERKQEALAQQAAEYAALLAELAAASEGQ